MKKLIVVRLNDLLPGRKDVSKYEFTRDMREVMFGRYWSEPHQMKISNLPEDSWENLCRGIDRKVRK